jgi:hypothetical protein
MGKAEVRDWAKIQRLYSLLLLSSITAALSSNSTDIFIESLYLCAMFKFCTWMSFIERDHQEPVL